MNRGGEPKNRLGVELGFALVGVLIAFAMLTVGAAAAWQVTLYYQKSVRQRTQLGEVDDLRRYVRQWISCEKTVATELAHCNGTDLINTRTESCSIFSSTTPSLVANTFSLRVRCGLISGGTAPLYGLRVEYTRMFNTTTAAPNPMTGVLQTPKDLFDGVPLTCSYVPPSGNTIAFADRRYVDKFLRLLRTTIHPEYPEFVTLGHTSHDKVTALKVCELAGCTGVIQKTKRKFSSPSNNYIFTWVPASSNFVVSSASTHNQYIDYLSCDGCLFGGGAACP